MSCVTGFKLITVFNEGFSCMHYEGGFGEISLKRNRSPSPQSPQISERHEVTGVTPKARGEGSRGSTRDGPTDETMSRCENIRKGRESARQRNFEHSRETALGMHWEEVCI